jgi:N6-L-threonylcarbamoyladenine synthase
VKGKELDFSFSGLKTAVLYALKGQNTAGEGALPLTEQNMCDIAASFQHAALTDVVDKTLLAAEMHGCSRLVFGGGVTNNMALRRMVEEKASGMELFWPPRGLSLDNAAMIAGLGFHRFKKQGRGDSLDLEPATRIAF